MITRNNLTVPLLGHRLLLVVITITCIGLMPGTATAMSSWEMAKKNALVVLKTKLGIMTYWEEAHTIKANWDEWRKQREDEGKTSVGQVAVNSFYPVAEYRLNDLGTTEILTYMLIDPATGQRTTPAFEVSSVRYEALLQPPTSDPCELTEALIRANLTLLGTSADAAHDFALNFTLQGFEPMILGFPLDATGNEITGEGTAGFDSHVLLPDLGQSCFNVSCGRSYYGFNVNPIPADFFGPGSDPFAGVVELDGSNPSGPDTIIRRLADFKLPAPPSTDTVQIELVALSLKSCAPITITGGGNPDELWDLQVDLSVLPAPPGTMTAVKEHANGGTFTSELYVQPRFTFTKVSDPIEVRVLDTGQEGIPPIQLNSPDPYPWRDTSPKSNPPCDGMGFYPLGPEPLVMQSATMVLELLSPQLVSPYIALDSEQQWQEALDDHLVDIVDFSLWQQYFGQWRNPQEGEPYPDNTFLPPELSVWPGSCCPDDQLSSPGLVMAWGDPKLLIEGESYSSAWMYQYPDDPDLTNVTITITVFPPCGMNVVSFGMKDINGNFRAWYWNVGAAPGPGMLQCGIGTTININTALTGVGAAAPAAASYTSAAGFDITQVVTLIFDENNVWVAGTAVPPPGTTVARPWNYWRDLIITPNPAPGKPDNPRKWSQPPVEVAPQVYLGWDEESVRDKPPLMADDWLCQDPRPVTDIHWWGSFINWDTPEMPPDRPIAFHFGIWEDVPKDAANPFSHPRKLIWEYICKDYVWNFAGYDKDPRNSTDPTVHDSCFQFYCDLPVGEWFYQKPNPNGNGRVYWLSIAAIYDSNKPDLNYPWGWKTRPHFFNDDAVRIFELADGSWPPSVGSAWGSGEPVEYPEKISWDLSFELTTNEDEPNMPNPDLNLDGIFNFKDLLFDRWLERWP